MLYWLAQTLDFAGVFNLIRYLSFRAGAAIATALIIGLVIGPKFIGWLRVRQGKGQPLRTDGPQTHLAKRGTPTMPSRTRASIRSAMRPSMMTLVSSSRRLSGRFSREKRTKE